nr:MAG TPA: hypothetical protein [Caudoviricetes sp.]
MRRFTSIQKIVLSLYAFRQYKNITYKSICRYSHGTVRTILFY